LLVICSGLACGQRAQGADRVAPADGITDAGDRGADGEAEKNKMPGVRATEREMRADEIERLKKEAG